MDRTEAATQIVLALIEKNEFGVGNYQVTDEELISNIRKAFENIYATVKACENNRSNAVPILVNSSESPV